jgi:hypothetical protein
MATYQQELFNYLYDEFGVIALETEMKEIEEIVLKFQSEKVLDNQKNKIVSMREIINTSSQYRLWKKNKKTK